MKSGWSETRPNGHPIEQGTFCWVQDLEDGTHPIYIYGKSKDEVFDKLDRQNMHAQAALARRTSNGNGGTPPAAPAPAAPARVISAGDVMQATADLDNPAKAGEAVATLVQSATGVDLRKLAVDGFARMAQQWQDDTPEFYPHPGNKRLLADTAKARVGGNIANVTRDTLIQVFSDLRAQGLLFDEPAPHSDEPPPSTLNTPLPGESPVQRTERPRGTRFATGTRSTAFSAPSNAQTRTLKYTEEQIRTMPLSRSKELINSNDRDYTEACDFYFGQKQATA